MAKLESLYWEGQSNWIYPIEQLSNRQMLMQFDKEIYLINNQQKLSLTNLGKISTASTNYNLHGIIPPLKPNGLGNRDFTNRFNLSYAYMSGAMANGIASTNLVIAMAKAGFLASFGAAGLSIKEIENAIHKIKTSLTEDQTFAFNLIHSPKEPLLEKQVVELYIKNNINVIEASAFMDISESIVLFRAKGLIENGIEIEAKNKIIAKISRPEVAEKFMSPAPSYLIEKLYNEKLIDDKHKILLSKIPLADAITVEADSGGHTDNRPLVTLLPQIIALKNQLLEKYKYGDNYPLFIGAAGGVSTPDSVLCAYTLGADYVVTGSINQCCLEANTSEYVKNTLIQAKADDTIMAPAADMFEMGVNVQVLKKGTMYPMRARKLYSLYTQYNSIEQIPNDEKLRLESQLFRKTLDQIWEDTKNYFSGRDQQLIQEAEDDPKQKMALIFRWYLGQSSFWATAGVQERNLDYQIWCGPSQAAFNRFIENSYLIELQQRHVVQIAKELMNGATYLARINLLKMYGVTINNKIATYLPSLDKSLKHDTCSIA